LIGTSELTDLTHWSTLESLICMTVRDPYRFLVTDRCVSLVFCFLLKLNFVLMVSIGLISHIIVSGRNRKLFKVELLNDWIFNYFLSLYGLPAFSCWYFKSDWLKYFSCNSSSFSFEMCLVKFLFYFYFLLDSLMFSSYYWLYCLYILFILFTLVPTDCWGL